MDPSPNVFNPSPKGKHSHKGPHCLQHAQVTTALSPKHSCSRQILTGAAPLITTKVFHSGTSGKKVPAPAVRGDVPLHEVPKRSFGQFGDRNKSSRLTKTPILPAHTLRRVLYTVPFYGPLFLDQDRLPERSGSVTHFERV